MNEIGYDGKGVGLIDKYEEFLKMIDDPAMREHLSELKESEVYQDSQFMKCRKISRDFQAVLNEICFSQNSPLGSFIMEYGVF